MSIPIPEYECIYVPEEFSCDGNLNKYPWTKANWLTLGHKERSEEPKVLTKAAAFWSENLLYIAFSCEDPQMIANMTNRDDKIYEEEAVEVFIQPDPTKSMYFELQVSPANIVYDALITNYDGAGKNIDIDISWDSVGIQTAVKRTGPLNPSEPTEGGFDVEMHIPLKSLSYLTQPPKEGDQWRINFYRIDRKPFRQFLSWSHIPRECGSFHTPSRFGRIIFVK